MVKDEKSGLSFKTRMSHYRLKCVISNIVEAPQYVTWYLNSKVQMMITMRMIL